MQRPEVDLHQHRDDHHPDEETDREIDLGHLQSTQELEGGRDELTESDADQDAQGDPQA